MIRTDIQNIKLRFNIIGNTEALNRAIETAVQVAPTDLSVLVTGESGVGKESFPKIIHQFSSRKHNAYIAVNCGAIPEGTIDSELFGHEKGSFTGAISDRNGYFAEANGGTIFLDEVGELPLSTQARLLRVLESGEYIKVGSSKVQKTDVRIVAATNVNLTQAIQEGRFREDLYYRLNTVPIQVPALRNRGDDVVLLFRKFASDFAEKYKMPGIQLYDDAKQVLVSYSWPGNIRQLKNITEQISIIEPNRNISADIVRKYLPEQPAPQYPVFPGAKNKGQGFENELFLYKAICEMKNEIDHLKAALKTLLAEQSADGGSVHHVHEHPYVSNGALPLLSDTASIVMPGAAHQVDHVSGVVNTHTVKTDVQDYQDTEEYVEENLSLDEAEKEIIKKALERHHGKRKSAAADLKISERTLYRKIKEYGLD